MPRWQAKQAARKEHYVRLSNVQFDWELDCFVEGLKLLDQVMKVLLRVAEIFLWQVLIDDRQFGFMPGRSATDAIFIVHQLQEKSHASTRHCTWPLSISKGHLIVYPDMSSGGLFASLALRSGWCNSYRACMKMPKELSLEDRAKQAAWKENH